MVVRNKISMEKFETSKEEFQRLIVDKGFAHKYEVVEDETPIEIKSLREMKLNRTKEGKGTITEAKLKNK